MLIGVGTSDGGHVTMSVHELGRIRLIMHWLVYYILSGICACGCIHKCNDSLSVAIGAYYDIYFQQGKAKALHSNT